MSQNVGLALLSLITYAVAQQPGAYTPEVHPSLPSQRCTTSGGCVSVNSSIVLDANYRWLHNVGGYTNCVNGGFNTTFCPDVETCAKNCALEGVDYSSYGITTKGNALTLNLYTQKGGATSMSSPRVYLLQDENTYDLFKLLNKEFTFDVDVSKVPCGINGALYLSEMSATGGASALNAAGAKYGTGYCDAQCPQQNFFNGEANLNNTYGSCCNEMDLWEANNAATALTPHPCNITGPYKCSGAHCGSGSAHYDGVCDEDGCDYNPYRMGTRSYYGPNMTVDTSRKFTVVTQFPTNDNTTTGTLKEIRRLYVQDGKVIHNAALSVAGITPTNAISDSFCSAQKKVFGGTNAFAQQGGMAGMGGALGRGMVLVFSIWDDAGSGMLWLDSTYPTTSSPTAPGVARGPCSTTSGNATDLIAKYPDAAVTFSNIKTGDIGSTFAATNKTMLRYRDIN
ncbi:glycoside hydrolase family 7 protein [Glonium stellatum]|uniref:Glucanase n=1 Tax=Glonium stellatum TaxID=574774 RepID=A0A8E2JSE2_9PEZI|nr:glycoside hydrolase family 7 protein [Glonium stellatum]